MSASISAIWLKVKNYISQSARPNRFGRVLTALTGLTLIVLPSLSHAQMAESTYKRSMDAIREPMLFIPLAIGLGIIVVFLILGKPVQGLAGLMVFYPFLGSTSGISILELVSALMLLLFVVAWLAGKRLKKPRFSNPLKIEDIFEAWMLFLVVNSILSAARGTPILDIVRDFVPLGGLLVFPVARIFVRTDRQLSLLVKVQLVVMAALTIRLAHIHLFGYSRIHAILSADITAYYALVLLIVSAGIILYKKEQRLLFLGLAIPAALYFVLSLNRTGFLTALASIAGMILLVRRSRYVVGLTLVGVILFWGLYLVAERVRTPTMIMKEERLMASLSGEDLSILSRQDEARQCWATFLRNPFIGVGMGHRYVFWRHYVRGIGAGYQEDNLTHSDLMNMLAKSGVIGTGLFLLFYATALRLAWRLWKLGFGEEQRMKGIIAMTSLIAAFVMGQSVPILQDRKSSLLLGFLIAFTVLEYRKFQNDRYSRNIVSMKVAKLGGPLSSKIPKPLTIRSRR